MGALAGAVLTLALGLLSLQQLLWPDVNDCASFGSGKTASPWSRGFHEDDAVDSDYATSVGEGFR